MTPATRIPFSVCLFITPDWCTSRHTHTGTDTHADALTRSCLAELSPCVRIEGFWLLRSPDCYCILLCGCVPSPLGLLQGNAATEQNEGSRTSQEAPLSPLAKWTILRLSSVFFRLSLLFVRLMSTSLLPRRWSGSRPFLNLSARYLACKICTPPLRSAHRTPVASSGGACACFSQTP